MATTNVFREKSETWRGVRLPHALRELSLQHSSAACLFFSSAVGNGSAVGAHRMHANQRSPVKRMVSSFGGRDFSTSFLSLRSMNGLQHRGEIAVAIRQDGRGTVRQALWLTQEGKTAGRCQARRGFPKNTLLGMITILNTVIKRSVLAHDGIFCF